MDGWTAGLVGGTFVLAGLVKGTIGLGLPTVAVGLLGLVMPTAEAAALLVVPSLVTNAWQLAAGPALGPLLRRFWPLLLGIGVGTALAAGSLTAGRTAQRAMGLSLLVYGVLGLVRIELPVRPVVERWASFPVGVATGAITAATGTFVLPGVPYLQSLGLRREVLIQVLGLSFTASTVALAGALWSEGALRPGALGGSVLALGAALARMWAGGWLRGRVAERTFRLWFFAGLVTLSGHLILG